MNGMFVGALGQVLMALVASHIARTYYADGNWFLAAMWAGTVGASIGAGITMICVGCARLKCRHCGKEQP